MRKVLVFLTSCLLLSIVTVFAGSSPMGQKVGSRPLCFTENRGQWNEDVKFRCDAGGAIVWICKDRIVYQFLRTVERAEADRLSSDDGNQGSVLRDPVDKFNQEPDSIEQLVIIARFVNPNPDVQVVGEGKMEYRCNYFVGNDPSKWYTDVANYEVAVLRGVYDGVELRFVVTDRGWLAYRYNFTSASGAAMVKIAYDGLDQLEKVRLINQSRWGEITGLIRTPQIEIESMRIPSPGSSEYMRMGSLAEPDQQTVQLVYSTYLGGTGYNDFSNDIVIDASGSAYVTGGTTSVDFPTQNSYDGSLGGSMDVFVSKLSYAGNSLDYSTFLGGTSGEYAYGIAIDSAGAVYVTGLTNSTDFPTLNAYDNSPNGSGDAFISKLSATGNSLAYSTYLGGMSDEYACGIAVDFAGSVYVTGQTSSSDFPTQSVFDPSSNGNYDAFISKLSTAGDALVYSTFLGGIGDDFGRGITIDDGGSAYVTGYTSSTNFPTMNAYDDTFNGGDDVFVTRISHTGSTLTYSTYLGGTSLDYGSGIAVDGTGRVYVTGHTYSSTFPTYNALDASHNGDYDVFATKLSSDGDSLIYSTFVGGSNRELSDGIAIDVTGSAYFAGQTHSPNLPVPSAFDGSFNGLVDGFVFKLSATGSALIYCTYLGGMSEDRGYGIAVDDSGSAYVTGTTTSNDFPTLNAFDDNLDGYPYSDVFVSKLSRQGNSLCGDADGSEILTISDAVYLISYIFSGGPAPNPVLAGDADCNVIVTISDAVYLINYIFSGGPAPCAACP